MRLSTSLTILLSSVIIALGLYFGLRTPPVDVAPQPSTPAAAPAPVTPQPPAPQAPTEAQTTAHVNDLVARVLPSWKAACWDSLEPGARKPGRYTATLAFDATGKLVIFGITEIRGESDMAVAECLRKQEHAFSVPAPGRPLTFDVPFQMP